MVRLILELRENEDMIVKFMKYKYKISSKPETITHIIELMGTLMTDEEKEEYNQFVAIQESAYQRAEQNVDSGAGEEVGSTG